MVTRLLRLDAPPKPADAADALALAICHIWRAAPAQNRLQQARRRRTGRPARIERPYRMIAFVSGPVAALAPTTAVIEVGGVGMAVQCTPEHPRPGCASEGGQARHLPRRPGGLAHAVRLRRRRRAAGLRAAADRERRRPAARPGDARRAHPGRAAGRRRHRRREGADRRARHRQEGRAEAAAGAEGPARGAGRRHIGRQGIGTAGHRPAGATSCTPR